MGTDARPPELDGHKLIQHAKNHDIELNDNTFDLCRTREIARNLSSVLSVSTRNEQREHIKAYQGMEPFLS